MVTGLEESGTRQEDVCMGFADPADITLKKYDPVYQLVVDVQAHTSCHALAVAKASIYMSVNGRVRKSYLASEIWKCPQSMRHGIYGLTRAIH